MTARSSRTSLDSRDAYAMSVFWSEVGEFGDGGAVDVQIGGSINRGLWLPIDRTRQMSNAQ